MTNILVIGVSGMLGSMVFDYLSKNKNLNVYGTVRNAKYQNDRIFLFDANDISQLEDQRILNLNIGYVINCIGITKPFSKDDDPIGVVRAIRINSDFPWELAEFAKKYNIRVIQIGTDCVFSGKKGQYNEIDKHDPLDVYGKSKSLGEVFDKTTLIIRGSIIGPEFKKEVTFLLEWFLNQQKGGTISGWEHHLWNGITTLQFAQICERIIESNNFEKLMETSYIHHFVPNEIVNKYELMNIFNVVFDKKLKIDRVNKPDEKVDRTLSSNFDDLSKLFNKSDIKTALIELSDYIKRSVIYTN
ncbi:MAG: dTDP-4-dehydrorhamnose reductase family protein [Promethearchaeota archaeon]|jgi:dTDP-4-dehydrorhamnose reductase